MNSTPTLFARSTAIVPGGVHSPVRSFKGLDMTPKFFTKGQGAYLYDTEGENYIDFCMSFGPLMLGHQDPQVKASLSKALERGWTFGTCEPYSLELAEYLVEKINFIEQIRFVNSGTEAVMTALRLARGATHRNKIIKFNGCYHGHTDAMLIKAGSGLAGTAQASSAGIPEGIAKDTLILELGDKASVQQCFAHSGEDIAAIIIEPLPANNGLLKQDYEFLKFLRKITKENGALLIFDEVITGFRIGFGGVASKAGITPDLVTYGKIIGGGLPVGAIAGPKKLMQYLAPIGDVYQAGTLSANPLAMVAGLETLKQLTDETYAKIEQYSASLSEIFNKWFHEWNNGEFNNYKIISESSLFWIVPTDTATNVNEIPKTLTEDFRPLFATLLDKGIYLSPNAYEVGFVSLAHDETVLKDLTERLWH